MKLVSLVIPCYNVEKYISECLDSIIKQSIGLENIEIIAVDDCSSDSTVGILKSYEEKYPDNIGIVLLDENSKQGTARNVGLSYASGRYICFVDGDDYIHPSMLKQLVEVAEKNNCDIVQYRYTKDIDKFMAITGEEQNNAKIYVYDDEIRKNNIFYDDILNCSCTTKLYKKELLDDTGVYFAEGVCYEEPLFTFPLKLYADCVAVLETPFYFYRTNSSSTTQSTMNSGDSLLDHPYVQEKTWKFVRNTDRYWLYKEEIDYYLIHTFFHETIYFAIHRGLKVQAGFVKELAKGLNEILPEWKYNKYFQIAIKKDYKKEYELLYMINEPNSVIDVYLECLYNDIDVRSKVILERISVLAEKMPSFDKNHDAEKLCLTYEYLLALFYATNSNVIKKDIYKRYYQEIMSAVEKRCKEKIKAGDKISVSFIVISAAEWPSGDLYEKLENDNRFSSQIIPVPLVDRDVDSRKDSYRKCYEAMLDKGYNVVKVYDEEKDICFGWPDNKISDIVVFISSWWESIPREFRPTAIPLDRALVYVQYGIYLANNGDESFAINCVYNKELMNICYKVYTDSQINLQEFKKYQLLEGMNVYFSGYSKMDFMYKEHIYSEEDIRKLWKIPADKNYAEMKKIILAPHFSIGNNNILNFSTFHWNVYFWMYLAKKNIDKVSFIFKPHPNLRRACVANGLFDSYEAYDLYIDELNNLPNAVVYTGGDYLQMFITSDAMIMDSGSFIGEYLYSQHPLLFLTRPGQNFNRLGNKIMDSHYKCPGNDFAAIEKFIDDVVFDGNDVNKNNRIEIFEQILDYKKINGCLASEFIYDDFNKLVV